MNLKKHQKYLLIAIIAMTLSACGSGGGGGGSSNNNNNNNASNSDIITRGDRDDNQTLTISGRIVEVKGEIEGRISNFTGINTMNSDITNRAEIDVNGGNSIGISSENSTIKNYGEIDVEGSNSIGILGKNNSKIYNYNKIEIDENTTGIEVQSNSIVINNGIIQYDIEDDHPLPANSYSVGIKLANSTGENNGKIILNSGRNLIKLDGVYIGENSQFLNTKTGIITVSSTEAGAGMRAVGNNSIGKNEGTINVSGSGTYGMIASNGGLVINESTGIINVSSNAAGAMYAGFGSKAINYGTINIDQLNNGNSTTIYDTNGQSVPISGMNTSGGVIENYGNINIIGSVTVRSAYSLGTTSAGDFGKLSGETIVLDGEITVSQEITKGSYNDEYYLDRAIVGNEIRLGDNYQLKVDSILYTAQHVLDGEKLAIKLSKRPAVLSDFVNGPEKETAKILNNYYSAMYYGILDVDGKKVIDSIDVTSKAKLKNNLSDLTPTIYSTVTKQILDIDRTFNEFEQANIDALKETLDHSYVFNLVTQYQDTSDRNDIEGYDSMLVGFIGTKKFSNGIYGSLGYGHTKLDYDSKKDSKINTIFAGIYKRFEMNTFNIDLGVNGEYNFHETEREIGFLNRNVKSKYNSYLIKLDLEISKIYGDKYYFMPYAGIGAGIGKYEDIKEKNGKSVNAKLKSETFSTITPKIGGKVGIKNGPIHLYASAEYLYEIGDVDKNQKYSISGFSGYGKLPNYDVEGGKGIVAIGIEYKKGGMILGVSGGKRYESKGNNETIIKGNIGYRF
ncbi:autotransporter outer membrane beta-barrel domain-containing protein [Fusobacterium sp. PH5-44]|uniref:autotransporter outer membrane beta-barrel domain-containing protein n=1 Tax=unclassified Fusobacterium TaxID=2648384 RepID=UPI003D212422